MFTALKITVKQNAYFFNQICPHSVTVKQWYQLLLEKGVAHTSENSDFPTVLIPSKVDERHPAVDFPAVKGMSWLFGLSPEQKSFIFKMI